MDLILASHILKTNLCEAIADFIIKLSHQNNFSLGNI